MKKQFKQYGYSVHCFEDGPHGLVLCRVKHFIAPDPDTVHNMAMHFMFEHQYIYDKMIATKREVMSFKDQFAQG